MVEKLKIVNFSLFYGSYKIFEGRFDKYFLTSKLQFPHTIYLN